MTSDRLTLEQLVSLAAGELPAPDAARIEALAQQDPAASNDLARLREVVESLRAMSSSPTDALTDRVKCWMTTLPAAPAVAGEIVAELLFDSQAGPMAGYRGALAERHLMFRAGDAELDIQMTAEPDRSGHWQIIGQLDASGPTIPSLVELIPAAGGEPLARTMIGLDGGFTLDAAAGRYTLNITWPGGTLVVKDFDVP